MNKKVSIIIISALIIGVGIILIFSGSGAEPNTGNNIVVKDGIQYITISAKGGYTPRSTTAEANIPTKLIMKTNGAYDCSSFLNINSINYHQALPQNGEITIDLGVKKPGEILQGVCGMGMYNFSVKFN